MSRLPQPSPPDYCGGCGHDRPLYLLDGASGDHVHRCRDGLREALAGEDIRRLDTDVFVATPQTVLLLQERDEARAWARELWVLAGDPWLRHHPEMGPPPDWLTRPEDQL